MSSIAISSGLLPAVGGIAPSWMRPATEKTAPVDDSQRDRERQPPNRDTVSRTRETQDTVSLSRVAQALIEGRGLYEVAADLDLTAEEQQNLEALQSLDAEVHQHEQAHRTTDDALVDAGKAPIDVSAELSHKAVGKDTTGNSPETASPPISFTPAIHAYDTVQGFGTIQDTATQLDLVA